MAEPHQRAHHIPGMLEPVVDRYSSPTVATGHILQHLDVDRVDTATA